MFPNGLESSQVSLFNSLVHRDLLINLLPTSKNKRFSVFELAVVPLCNLRNCNVVLWSLCEDVVASIMINQSITYSSLLFSFINQHTTFFTS